jgi:hypothetical protein
MGWARFPALQAGLSHNGLAALNGYQWSNPVPLIQHSYNEQEHVGNDKDVRRLKLPWKGSLI